MHFLPLPLGEVVRSNAFLQELQATLFLANSEQLLCPPLIGSKPYDLPDQVPHELVVLGELAFGLGGFSLKRKVKYAKRLK